MDPITRYSGNQDEKDILNRFYGYNFSLAQKMTGTGQPYTIDDFLQVGRLSLLTAWKTKPSEPDKFYKQVIRFGMRKFRRDMITKVNRNEKAYREIFERYWPQFDKLCREDKL